MERVLNWPRNLEGVLSFDEPFERLSSARLPGSKDLKKVTVNGGGGGSVSIVSLRSKEFSTDNSSSERQTEREIL